MIKFVRNHIFIVCFTAFILVSGFIVLWQTNQAKAAGIDYNTISELTPEEQVASYAYYLALKDCISTSGADNTDNFNSSIVGSDISEIFEGKSKLVSVGYIAEQFAIKTVGASSSSDDIDGAIQCQTVAKAAFKLWGIGNSTNLLAELTGFGYTQQKTYNCIAYMANDDYHGSSNQVTSEDITLPYANDKMPKLSYLGQINTEDELNTFCTAMIDEFYSTTAVTAINHDGATHNWAEKASGLWTTTKTTLLGKLRIYIKANIYNKYTDTMGNEASEPTIDDVPGLAYYLNKYYFESTNICSAVNKGLDEQIKFTSGGTNLYDQNESNKITSGAYGPYKTVPVIEDVSGTSNLYGYIMTGTKAKSNDSLPLWVGTITNCGSVADTLISESKKITDYINSNPGSTLYSAIITASGKAGAISEEILSNGSGADTCGSVVTGLGWIMCPIINGLTGLNDGMWDLATGLLTVKPLAQVDSNGTSSIYIAWGAIRNIANVIFVIVFLVMIFSQLTSAGISNYGIKKLLPRLVIGAILVNISFLLMQIAVDLSNILGSSLNDVLISITPAIEPSWVTFANMVLTNVTATGAAVVAITLLGGSGAVFWMLLPIAAMGALALFAAIFTLIFRQAIIIILAILAPLAIVASLLPNTESWFKKWKDEFMQMLLLYPLAAIIFGGSQFAANLVINDGTNVFNYLIGLIMLTLPLFSLPFIATKGGKILSTAGGALNKLAEKARNPIKGFAKGFEDQSRAKYLADDKPRGGIGGLQRQAYRRMQGQKKTRESNTKTYGEQFNTQWAGSDDKKMGDGFNANKRAMASKNAADEVQMATQHDYSTKEGKDAIDRITKAKMLAHTDESDAANRVEEDDDESVLNLRMGVKAADARLKSSQAETDRIAREASTHAVGAAPGVSAENRLALQNAQRKLNIESSATNSATRIQQQEYEAEIADTRQVTDAVTGVTTTVASDAAIQAAGIDTQDGRGVTRLQAIAQSAGNKRESEEMTNAEVLIRSRTNPTDLMGDVSKELSDAITKGDTTRARAAQSILLNSGAPGIAKVHKAIAESGKDGEKDDETINKLRADINAANLKGKDVVLSAWGYSQFETDGKPNGIPKPMAELTSSKSFKDLNAVELAGNSVDVLYPKQKDANDNDILGVNGDPLRMDVADIDADRAAQVLDNPNASALLSKEARKYFMKKAGRPSPEEVQATAKAQAIAKAAGEQVQAEAQTRAAEAEAARQALNEQSVPKDQTEYFGP